MFFNIFFSVSVCIYLYCRFFMEKYPIEIMCGGREFVYLWHFGTRSAVKNIMGETLYIKNMVCGRCVAAVEQALAELEIYPVSVELGCVRLSETLAPERRARLSAALERLGFSLLEEHNSQVVAYVKGAVIEFVRSELSERRDNLSDYLSHRLSRDYSSISKLFSETCGITLEKFFIAQKIEYVKELLAYGELSLSEIADRLGYSSTAYLSSQFKRVTGMTPGEFRNLPEKKRLPLDSL